MTHCLENQTSSHFGHATLEALIWSNAQGTDGSIPRHMLGRISDEPDAVAAAAALVAVGLWSASDAGWDIVNFLDEQPSAEEVERRAALSRERQRRLRQHRNGDHSSCDPKYCHAASRVTSPVSDAVSHDTRTDPSVPNRAGTAKGSGTDGGLRTKPAPADAGRLVRSPAGEETAANHKKRPWDVDSTAGVDFSLPQVSA